MRIVFGLLGFGVILLVFILEGGHLKSLLHAPLLVAALTAPLLLCIAHHTPSRLSKALRAVVGTGQDKPEENAQNLLVLSTLRMLIWSTGAVLHLLGYIHTMQNLSDPSKIGVGIAVAFLSLLYALIFAEMLIGPSINRLKTSQASTDSGLNPANPSVWLISTSVFSTTLCFFIVLYATSSS